MLLRVEDIPAPGHPSSVQVHTYVQGERVVQLCEQQLRAVSLPVYHVHIFDTMHRVYRSSDPNEQQVSDQLSFGLLP